MVTLPDVITWRQAKICGYIHGFRAFRPAVMQVKGGWVALVPVLVTAIVPVSVNSIPPDGRFS